MPPPYNTSAGRVISASPPSPSAAFTAYHQAVSRVNPKYVAVMAATDANAQLAPLKALLKADLDVILALITGPGPKPDATYTNAKGKTDALEIKIAAVDAFITKFNQVLAKGPIVLAASARIQGKLRIDLAAATSLGCTDANFAAGTATLETLRTTLQAVNLYTVRLSQVELMYGETMVVLTEQAHRDALKGLMDTAIARAEVDHEYADARTKLNAVMTVVKEHANNVAAAIDEADDGHSVIRHGAKVTDALLQRRLTHALAPNGDSAPTGSSAKFADMATWLDSREKAFEQAAESLGVDVSRAPAAGAGKTIVIYVEHGKPIGKAFIGVKGKHPNIIGEDGNLVIIKNGPNRGKPQIDKKRFTQFVEVTGLTRTMSQLEWNEAAGRWMVKQQYPVTDGWDDENQEYTTALPGIQVS